MDSGRHLDTDGGKDLLRTVVPQRESIARTTIEGVPQVRPGVVSHLSSFTSTEALWPFSEPRKTVYRAQKKGSRSRPLNGHRCTWRLFGFCATEEISLSHTRMAEDRFQVRSPTLGDSAVAPDLEARLLRTQRVSIARYWVTRFPVWRFVYQQPDGIRARFARSRSPSGR